MATLVVGYNVEYLKDESLTEKFLRQVRLVHQGLEAPCTLYLLGEVVKEHRAALEVLAGNPLFDLQIAVRRPLKTVCQVVQGKTTLWRGASLGDIEEEIAETASLLKESFGLEARGLSSPLGYYRGLMDRPDVLEVLSRNGVRFCRTYGRDSSDWQPLEFSIEPFWYTSQGFSHILEFPGQGWQDSLIRPLYGWDEVAGYVDYLKGDLDETARRRDLVWSYWAHDWAAIRQDEELSIISDLLRYAREQDVEIETQQHAYYLLREREDGAERNKPEAGS